MVENAIESEDRQERLVKVIKRLEAKVRSIWEDKKALEERLELTILDKELAEERFYAMEESLSSESGKRAELEARVSELEELRALSIELEESYVAQKQELANAITELKQELNDANKKLELETKASEIRINELRASASSAQVLETLRQDLQLAKMQLAACKLDCAVERSGLSGALASIFEKEAPAGVDVLPYIDVYKLDTSLQETFDKFKYGDMSAQKFAGLIELKVQDAEKSNEDAVDWLAAVTTLRTQGLSSSMHFQKLLSRLKAQFPKSKIGSLLNGRSECLDINVINQIADEAERLQQGSPPDTVFPVMEQPSALTDATEALKLRVKSLETKLAQARELADEIDTLKSWQVQASARESQLQQLLADAEEKQRQKDHEITKLRRAELPTTIDAAVIQQKMSSLSGALQWYSRMQREHIRLDPLELAEPYRVSALTGNKRVSAVRKTVLDFDLVEAATDGKWRPRTRRAAFVAMRQIEQLSSL